VIDLAGKTYTARP